MNPCPPLLPPRPQLERALHDQDTAFDGIFYVAVRTTGIFCRPSCPSRPKAENTEFFASPQECLDAGYRPCKRCHPLEATGRPPAWVIELQQRADDPARPAVKAADLRALGVSPERARRWFQRHYGMSFSAWCRGRRLAGALAQLRAGTPLDQVALDTGFESHSGFRDAFARTFGEAPGRARHTGTCVTVARLESPLGSLLAGATDQGLCLLEFADRGRLDHLFESVRRTFASPVVPGDHPLIDQTRSELDGYFRGVRTSFAVPLAPRGTPFQEKVWSELVRIPFRETLSYDELARRIGQPTARRAVARANGSNRIVILIPCHRVIGKDGTLTGYGGGLWRKRLLLELERTGRLPSGP